MTKRWLWTAAALAVAVLLLGALLGGLTPRALAVGEPPPGAMSRTAIYTFYGPTALTGSGTATSATPLTVQTEDVSVIGGWYAADVFVTADISGTGTVTVTPQFSVDGSNWANADYTYISQSSINEVAVITPTSELTSSVSAVSTLATQTYQVVLSADGTDYVRVPLAGNRLRVSIEYTGTLTPTVQVMLRNN